MPDNLKVDQGNKNKHSTMATFDNPSYFTISGQSPGPTTTTSTDGVEQIGAKPKRFKSWFKLPKKAFRSKVVLNDQDPSADEHVSPPVSPTEPQPTSNEFANNDVVYYNFCAGAAANATDQQDPIHRVGETEAVNDDDVFSDTSTVREIGSTRTLSRRRHSLGSWFRSSLAAVRKQHNTASSTGSGLESHGCQNTDPSERPSTSSERGLLARNVSTSANCVASSTSGGTLERGRSSASETKVAKRSRLPVVVKSHVELRARARYARQEKLVRDNKAVSTSRIPRAVQSPHHRHQTTSLDRRYTKSTEVLTNNEPTPASGVTGPSVVMTAAAAASIEQLEADDSFQQREDSTSTRRKSISSTTTSRQRFVQRSRTIEDRHRSSCCGRMAAAAAASTSSRGERRRASLDATSPSSQATRRRCQRCRDKAEPMGSEKVDVVIIFSKNCVVAYQWITYLTEILGKMFSSNDRSRARVTSRDVESLVDCSTLPTPGRQHQQSLPTPPSSRFHRTEYQNITATEQLDAERNARQHAVRKTVSTSSLQIVLLSKALLHHVSLHANDPLGSLLHPKRVLGLILGVNETKDITPLHRSALISFEYWPKITMLDQDMESVSEFGRLAQTILCQSQPVALVEPKVQPVRFKIAPKKLRSGEERVSLILFETVENIQQLATVLVGTVVKPESVRIDKLTWINPYVASFAVPKTFLERGLLLKVQLKVGNASWGSRELKCQSKLAELSTLLSKCQLMGSPTEVMCQALNISPLDIDALDKALADGLKKTRLSVNSFQFETPVDEHRDQEFPTLLHFAARFGFKELVWNLLECIGAVQALYVRNFHGFTALQLAEMHGQIAVSNILKSFLQVVEEDKTKAERQIDNQNSDYVSMNHSAQIGPSTIANYDMLPKPKPVHSGDQGGTRQRNFMSEISSEDVYVAVLPNKYDPSQEDDKKLEATGDSSEETSATKVLSPVKQTSLTEEEIDEKLKIANDLLQMHLGETTPTIKEDGSTSNLNKPNFPLPMISVESHLSVLVSRGSSPLSNWSSSDRSSVTSHLSHDSGTHFESSEERKVLVNGILSDYDIPPATLKSRFVTSSYDIPPPPIPLKKSSEDRGDGSKIFRNVMESTSPRSSPRPPVKFRNPFETVEFNPPINQAILGEDLGRIVPIEEPELMEQHPILLKQSQVESVYMEMTPNAHRKFDPKLNTGEGAGVQNTRLSDDYLKTEDLNMPSISREKNQLTLVQRAQLLSSRMMSNSENQLLANPKEASLAEWHSDSSLAVKPIPYPRTKRDETPTPPVPPRVLKPDKSSKASSRKTRKHK